jgi:AraC-like DNA-binding protein
MRRLTFDLHEVRGELQRKCFMRSSDLLGPTEDVFRTSEHGYRRIEDSVLLHVMDFEVAQSYRLQMTRKGLVCIQINIRGSYDRWVGDYTERMSPAMIQISNQPRSIVETTSGMKLRAVLIVCERQYLLDHFGLSVDRIPPRYRPIFTSDAGLPEVLRLPNLPVTISIVDQLLTCKLPGRLRSLFIKAKVVELLCTIVAYINTFPEHVPMRARTSRNKSAAIESAASIYRREIYRPPTIEQLSARVGLNRNELTNGFRDRFGITPHHYAVMVRMKEAQSLLRDGKLSISEIARRVGYEGYSSFSRAYTAHFGQGPGMSDDGDID